MNTTITSLLSAFLIWTIVGCRSAVESVPNTPAAPTSIKYARSIYENNDLDKIPTDLTNQGNYLTAHEYMTVSNRLTHAALFIAADTLRDKERSYLRWDIEDKKVKTFLSSNMNDKYFSYLSQYCATQMIIRTDLLKKSSPQALSTLAYYTEMLIKEQSYNPVIIYNAFLKLKGYWSDDKMKSNAVETHKYCQNSITKAKVNLQNLSKALRNKSNEKPVAVTEDYLNGYEEVNHQNQLIIDKLSQLSR